MFRSGASAVYISSEDLLADTAVLVQSAAAVPRSAMYPWGTQVRHGGYVARAPETPPLTTSRCSEALRDAKCKVSFSA